MGLHLNRRHFLASSAAVATTSLVRAAPPRAAAPAPAIPDTAWRQLAMQLRGGVLRPFDATYAETAQPDNLRYAGILPAGIAQCFDEQDIRAAILWARENRVKLIARAGGHSYAGFSTTTGLMIDLRAMKGTRYNPATQEVTVQGGALNSDVYAALRGAKRTITHGRCPTVGAAAFLLGGGIGFNMRRNGLACDAVTRTDIVLADGTLKQGIKSGDDLYWACRGGGGGNFGINTSFTMKTIAAEPVTVFQLVWQSASVELGEALMQSLHAAPDTLGSRVSFRADQGRVDIDLLGQLRGSRNELLEILAPALRLARPYEMKIEADVDYWDGQDFLHEDPLPTYYQERSAYIPDQFPAQFLARGFEHLRRAPSTGGTRDLRFFQTGGKINAVADDATAFVHRNNHWLMVVGLYWDAATNANEPLLRSAHDWQNQFYQAMLPATDRMAYQNFPDPSLVDWRAAYYGKNFKKLHDIKTAVDPAQVFNFAQAI
jgi:FAD/FMN-containing dehydrogenase